MGLRTRAQIHLLALSSKLPSGISATSGCWSRRWGVLSITDFSVLLPCLTLALTYLHSFCERLEVMSAASKASENVKSQFHKVPLLRWGKFWFSVFVLCSVYIVCQERVLDNVLAIN